MPRKKTNKKVKKKSLTFWERVARGWVKFFQSTNIGGK